MTLRAISGRPYRRVMLKEVIPGLETFVHAAHGWRQGLTLVHFSPQPERFLSPTPTETTQCVHHKVLTTSRKVDECPAPLWRWTRLNALIEAFDDRAALAAEEGGFGQHVLSDADTQTADEDGTARHKLLQTSFGTLDNLVS